MVYVPKLALNVTDECLTHYLNAYLNGSTNQKNYVVSISYIYFDDSESMCGYKSAVITLCIYPNEKGEYTFHEMEFYNAVFSKDMGLKVYYTVEYGFDVYPFSDYYEVNEEKKITESVRNELKQCSEKLSRCEEELNKTRVLFFDMQTECQMANNNLSLANRNIKKLQLLSELPTFDFANDEDFDNSFRKLKNLYYGLCTSDIEFFEINKNLRTQPMVAMASNMIRLYNDSKEMIHNLYRRTKHMYELITDEAFRQNWLYTSKDEIVKTCTQILDLSQKMSRSIVRARNLIVDIMNKSVYREFNNFLKFADDINQEVIIRTNSLLGDLERHLEYIPIWSDEEENDCDKTICPISPTYPFPFPMDVESTTTTAVDALIDEIVNSVVAEATAAAAAAAEDATAVLTAAAAEDATVDAAAAAAAEVIIEANDATIDDNFENVDAPTQPAPQQKKRFWLF